MRYWIFLGVAALFETAWTYCLKYMKFSDLKLLRWHTFYRADMGLPILGPFLGYIVFGIANIVLFSNAIKVIPTPTAFAVWTALTLILIKLVDILYFRTGWSLTEAFFLLLITAGIIGLKASASV